ncbi:GntR family transcriptional regulator [Bacillus sp. AFS076308]|uniref:GntR family transcriptional regulator n=1 Tax=unclassified Bacillus (in: firmicutes) TaxID=185979 RepID=UPI000BF52668|nr:MULTISPECIES: GntR family transcriptional regulator [unclassified Bacillus (in: firmicutes)]PFN99454.1 GntR family transcriptional regulator [Bacillus sp. AFS076308]PGV55848.1 GntR family transcriptional regulator [Bacillus sp. AFS037270]
MLGSDRSRPAFHQSYEIIRDKILNGELPGGTKIVEEKVAAELGVSRTPIRESIRKLEQEGLIVNKRVVKPTEKDLRNMFQVRILLEGFSAKCAASYLKEDELESLYNCVEIGRKGTVEEIMRANERFHEIIVNASNNPVMIDIIDRMQSTIYLFRKTVVFYNRPHLIDEHEEIYEAIKARDGEKAEMLMKSHLQADLDFCLHLIGN